MNYLLLLQAESLTDAALQVDPYSKYVYGFLVLVLILAIVYQANQNRKDRKEEKEERERIIERHEAKIKRERDERLEVQKKYEDMSDKTIGILSLVQAKMDEIPNELEKLSNDINKTRQ
jgi:uncharacterized protein YlxW (UPF0749 family)